IHSDGLLKDEEIYNIFDTNKLLNRPVSVMISNTSGLAGIAYWINQHYELKGEQQVSKKDQLVLDLKAWIDELYAAGRTTSLSNKELEKKIAQLSGGKMTVKK
ncbi:MAG: 2-isopropylmalate synthase, partial [Clostridia bacterium]|nr:2-isopropylmalate synthase [Clostridia bacterium]